MVTLRALNRKLLRDLWRMRGQAIAIGLVIGGGAALYVLMFSVLDSLYLTRSTYYSRYRFADVFVSVKRAPLWLSADIARIPGVARVEVRVVADVTLDLPGLAQPAGGRLVSIPDDRRPTLCDLYIRDGRYLEPGRDDEVLVSETFATANDLRPGDSLVALINGRRRALQIVGVALSPEYIYAIRSGELISDDRLFGVMWMGRRPLAAAFDMEGAFNDAVVALQRGASERDVIAQLDRLLEPYGSLGAIPRTQQLSNFYLENELTQLRGSGRVLPIIFLAVAAFLLNVVLSRLISVQREEIAALKALGYSHATVGWHYAKLSLLVAAAGTAVGVLVGAWIGAGMTRMYTAFFHFPILAYRLAPAVVAEALLVGLAAAILGAVDAVRRVVALPPAEAMRPAAPARYRVSWVERTGVRSLISQPARIILRNLQRRPGRALSSAVGIAAGGALIIVGTFSLDAIDRMIDVQFNVARVFDVVVTFVEPASPRAAYEVARLPGVLDAEPFRAVPVRLRFGPRSRVTAITGLPPNARLNRVVDTAARIRRLPPEGLVLSKKLAELLHVTRGDVLTVQVLEGTRPIHQVAVADLVDEYLGTNAYMALGAIHRLMHEEPVLSGAYLLVDERAADDLYRRVKATPAVAAITTKQAAVDAIRRTIAESMAMLRSIVMAFAAVIAFGVVYNTARISLSERSRELATLRVIGFSRVEISYILLGELALLTLASLPLALLLGYLWVGQAARAFETDLFRFPAVISPRTYALAVITVVAASAISALVVRRRLDRLDLVAVLKTRE